MSAFELPGAGEASGGLFDAYALLRDEKAAGTDGGTFTQDAWRTRTLNVEKFDVGAIVTLAGNRFTLAAGTYEIEWWACVGGGVSYHKTKLQDITGAAVVGDGSSEYTGGGGVASFYTGRSTGRARVTLGGTSELELQHYCKTTLATVGFGQPANIDGRVEVYAEVEIRREA